MQQDNSSQRRLFISAYVFIAAIFLAINVYSFLGYDGFLYIYPRHWKYAHSHYVAAFVFFGVVLGISLCGAIAISCLFKNYLNKNIVFNHVRSNFIYIIAFCLVLVIAISYFALDRFENSSDEFVYVFQALTMLEGRVHSPAPPIPDSFSNAWMIEKANRWVGQYSPGWPAILAAANLIGIPFWLVNPLFGAGTVWLLYLLAKYAENRTVAITAVVVLVTSPFFLFNSASYFSHVSFALMATVYAFGVVRYRDTDQLGFLILAGFGLGMAFSIRNFPAVLLFLPIFLIPGSIKQRLRLLLGIGIGAGPIVIAVLGYHYAAYGDPFVTGYTWQPEKSRTSLSFKPIAGLFITVKKLYELAGWSGTLMLLLYGFSLIYKVRKRQVSFIDYLFPVVLIGMFFFPHSSGNRYGPRYLYDVYPFLVFSTVSGLVAFTSQNRGFWTRVVNNVLVTSVLYCLCLVPLVAVYFHGLVADRQALYRAVHERKLRNAIVLVDTWTSNQRRMNAQELIRNDPNLSASVLYARGDDPMLFKQHFPEREIWVYRREDPASPAKLSKLADRHAR